MLTAGLRNDELTGVRTLVTSLLAPEDFVIDPLPNLLFTRDSSVWVDDHVAVTSPSMLARARERFFTQAVYEHSPRFAGTPLLYGGTRKYWLRRRVMRVERTA